jgi:hypothetical protein
MAYDSASRVPPDCGIAAAPTVAILLDNLSSATLSSVARRAGVLQGSIIAIARRLLPSVVLIDWL